MIIGKLLVDMDNIGIGPGEGIDPVFYHIYCKMVKAQYRRYFYEIGEHRQDEENQ